jgi:hypothetical protein
MILLGSLVQVKGFGFALAAGINHRDVPHAGLKVVGDTPFKYLAVHVVDKGAPLYDAPPK